MGEEQAHLVAALLEERDGQPGDLAPLIPRRVGIPSPQLEQVGPELQRLVPRASRRLLHLLEDGASPRELPELVQSPSQVEQERQPTGILRWEKLRRAGEQCLTGVEV